MKLDLVVAGYIFNKGKVLLVHHRKLDLWLPVGGHIEKDETPDEAMLREIKEEVNMDVEILGMLELPHGNNVEKNLATPFHVNVHYAGDHKHCCFFYVCKAVNPEKLKINGELKEFGWFTKEDLNKSHVPLDVKHIALKGFGIFGYME